VSKKRRRPDYLAPERQAATPSEAPRTRTNSSGPSRPGGLLGLFGPRDPALNPYPGLRASFGRGFLAVGSSLPILLTIIAVVFLYRMVLVAIGIPPRGSTGSLILAIPPLGAFVDAQFSQQVFGPALGTPFSLVFLLVRTLVIAILTGMILERLEHGTVSLAGVRRGLRALPALGGISVIGMGAVFVGSLVAGFSGLGGIGLFGVMGAAMHFLAYGPAIAAIRPMRLQATASAAVRAARVPGSQNLVIALGYTLISLLLMPLFVPGGALIAANPGFVTWVGILLANVVHVGFLATYSYRYLVAEPDLPEGPPRRTRRT
jgi:hypothetical protein